MDDILLLHVNDFHDGVLQRVNELADREQLGIRIDNCEILSVAPRQLKDVFDQVTTARENASKALADASSAANLTTNSAAARAATIIATAQSARNRYVESLSAEAKRFNKLLPSYESNPSLFAQQMLVPAMAQVLTNVDKWYLPENLGSQPPEVRLMLNREPPQPRLAPAATTTTP